MECPAIFEIEKPTAADVVAVDRFLQGQCAFDVGAKQKTWRRKCGLAIDQLRPDPNFAPDDADSFLLRDLIGPRCGKPREERDRRAGLHHCETSDAPERLAHGVVDAGGD